MDSSFVNFLIFMTDYYTSPCMCTQRHHVFSVHSLMGTWVIKCDPVSKLNKTGTELRVCSVYDEIFINDKTALEAPSVISVLYVETFFGVFIMFGLCLGPLSVGLTFHPKKNFWPAFVVWFPVGGSYFILSLRLEERWLRYSATWVNTSSYSVCLGLSLSPIDVSLWPAIH